MGVSGDLSTETIIFVLFAFTLAGFVKGIVGVGLPTVVLSLVVPVTGLASAIALTVVPTISTNIVQGLRGGHFWAILQRLWPFFVAAIFGVGFGTDLLARADGAALAALLGTLLVIYALLGLTGRRFQLTDRRIERWGGPFVGALSGLISGMVGSFLIPGVVYLNSLGLSRDVLIQALGIVFTLLGTAIAVGLSRNSLLTLDLAVLSAGAMLPALGGMALGERLRQRVSETVFRRLFFGALLALGLNLVLRAFV